MKHELYVSLVLLLFCNEGFAKKKLACPFKSDDYTEVDEDWADEVQPLKLDSGTFEQLLQISSTSLGQVLEENLYDTLGELKKFYDEWKASKKALSEFYETYVGKVYPGDNVDFAIKVLERIEASNADIVDHSYLVSSQTGMTRATVLKLNLSTSERSPDAFYNNHVAAVIKVSVNGILTYILLDPGLGLDRAVVINEDENNTRNIAKAWRRHKTGHKINFQLQKNYIVGEAELLDRAAYVDQVHVYHVAKPYCSFVKKTLKLSLLHKGRTIVRQTSDGKDVASLYVKLITKKEAKNVKEHLRKPHFFVDYDKNGRKCDARIFYDQLNSMEIHQRECFNLVASALNIKIKYLEPIKEIVQSDHFINAVQELGDNLKTKPNNNNVYIHNKHAPLEYIEKKMADFKAEASCS